MSGKFVNGGHPLPLVAALHVRSAETLEKYSEWIEMSPYEVFMPKYSVGIDMTKFSDRFDRGWSKQEYEEPPIHFLQGICGSAFTDVRNCRLAAEREFNFRFKKFKDWMSSFFNIFDYVFVGKIPNFLYGLKFHPELEPSDKIDVTSEEMMLVDAGIDFNSPYPLVLRPARNVDVIISFDFSDRKKDSNNPFEELLKAERWAIKKGIPFPDVQDTLTRVELDLNDKIYQDVYVFSGFNTPTIVHFVMINNEPDGFQIHPDYNTYRFRYSETDFEKFFTLIEQKVIMNTGTIIACIRERVREME